MTKGKKKKLKAATDETPKAPEPKAHDRRTQDLVRNAKVAPIANNGA